MSETIFLHYTQAELDRNFDQRGWVPNAAEVIARYADASSVARAHLEHRTASYGTGADEVLDIFPAAGKDCPVLVFIHGGAWRNFTKDDFSFVAAGLVPHGVATVVVNFSKLPEVRLPAVAAQLRRALGWIRRNTECFGGDPERLYLGGHSSGAHLAASLLVADPAAPPGVKGCVGISGCYDLRPVRLSARSAYVVLDAAEEAALSPRRHAQRFPCDVLVASAQGDTDEFQRQSEDFAAALGAAGRLHERIVMPEVNHFEIIEGLGCPGSDLTARVGRFLSP